MSDHVDRQQVREIIDRRNELERQVPILRRALEWIADAGPSAWSRIAQDALDEADRTHAPPRD